MMTICKPHWEAMRQKVDDLGLTFLIAKDAQECVERITEEIEAVEEGEEPKTFDPLMSMYFSFTNRVVETVGVETFMIPRDLGVADGMPENLNTDGQNCFCPLCIVRRDFNHHNTPTGMCGDPECEIRVHKGEQPWDEQWIDDAGTAMFKHAVKNGLLSVQ